MNDELKQKAIDIVNAINNQDNRATASPYYYVIRQEVDHPTSSDYGDVVYYYSDGDFCEIGRSRDEARAEILINEQYESELEEILSKNEVDNIDEVGDYEFDDFFKDHEFLNIGYYAKHDEDHKLFFTEDEAKAHLTQKKHWYNSTAHTYVKCANTSQVVMDMLEIISSVAGIDLVSH